MKKLTLYLIFALVTFGGMALSGIIAAVLSGMRDGTIIARISDIPYILLLALSVVISAVSFLLIFRKRK